MTYKTMFAGWSVFLAAIFFLTMAQDRLGEETANLQAKTTMENMTKNDFTQYYKAHHSRKPQPLQPVNPLIFDTTQTHSGPPPASGTSSLPINMTFPGEFEEVKAILMTWPYIFFDSTGKNSVGEQVFKNIGIYANGRLGKVIAQIDVSTNSDLANIFAALAKAINDNVEVWINVFKAADTTAIKNFMSQKNTPLTRARFFINPGNSFWYRDCGPVAFYFGPQDSLGFMDFEYYGGRPLDDSIPVVIGGGLGLPVFTTHIEYEGGNILLDGYGNLFCSDVVYKTNADNSGPWVYNASKNTYSVTKKTPLSQQQVQDSLKKLLNLRNLLISPMLKYDGGTGHIDLYADMWDENGFVFSQMPTQMKKLTDYSIVNSNVAAMTAFAKQDGSTYGKTFIPFPRRDDGSWYTSDTNYEYYTRTYSNHVFVNKTIIQPVFASQASGDYADMQKDLDSIKAKYPGYGIVPIDVRAFDGLGGAIHCITKQIPADNPLRIMHKPLATNADYKKSFPINATVYNKSGIAQAVCKWRYNGASAWNTASLADSGGNQFRGAIDNSLTGGTVEYYLEATSNNGKTIAKPITAPAGFYSFSFTYSGTSIAHLQLAQNKTIALIQQPSLKRLYLTTDRFDSDFEFKMISVTGRTVYSQHFNAKVLKNPVAINTAGIRSGAYLAVVKAKDGFIYKEKLTMMN